MAEEIEVVVDSAKQESLAEYKDYVLKLAKLKENTLFYNSGPEHAALVMGTMFANANSAEKIKIYTGSFKGDISSKTDYLNGMDKYLAAGGKVEILLQNDIPDKENSELVKLFQLYNFINPEQIVVKKHNYHVSRKNGTEEIHFMVAFPDMYRIEDDIVKFTAEANFNDPKTCSKLTNEFDRIFNSDDAQLYQL